MTVPNSSKRSHSQKSRPDCLNDWLVVSYTFAGGRGFFLFGLNFHSETIRATLVLVNSTTRLRRHNSFGLPQVGLMNACGIGRT